MKQPTPFFPNNFPPPPSLGIFFGLITLGLMKRNTVIFVLLLFLSEIGFIKYLFFTGYGEQNTVITGLSAGGFALPEPPTTPGPFAAGLTRNEGTIPGVGVAMPFSPPSLDTSEQGEQRQPLQGTLPVGAPPLPPGPHPSVLASGQQQAYQQFPQVPPQQQHLGLPQQMVSLPLQPPNLTQMQPPSHLPLLPHPHLPRPPPQLPPPGMPMNIPGSLPMPPQMQMPGPMVTYLFFYGVNFSLESAQCPIILFALS